MQLSVAFCGHTIYAMSGEESCLKSRSAPSPDMTTYLRGPDVMPLLLEACPSFRSRWAEHTAWRGYEPLLHVDIAEFADHLGVLVRTGADAELPRAFAMVERLLAEGDHDVQDAVGTSFTEGLWSALGSLELADAAFARYFGPRTAADWEFICRRRLTNWRRVRLWWQRRSRRGVT